MDGLLNGAVQEILKQGLGYVLAVVLAIYNGFLMKKIFALQDSRVEDAKAITVALTQSTEAMRVAAAAQATAADATRTNSEATKLMTEQLTQVRMARSSA